MKTQFSDFDTFFQAYLTTALWSSTDEQDNRKRSLENDGWSFQEHKDTTAGKTEWSAQCPGDWDGIPGEHKLSGHEYQSEAIDAAWEASGGGSADQALDVNYSASDFNPEALEILRAHCLSFWARMWFYIDKEKDLRPNDGDPVGTAGHDFWLTSNGHGAGFWDGDWPTYGDMLTKLSKCYPEIDITVGDDGKLHI